MKAKQCEFCGSEKPGHKCPVARWMRTWDRNHAASPPKTYPMFPKKADE